MKGLGFEPADNPDPGSYIPNSAVPAYEAAAAQSSITGQPTVVMVPATAPQLIPGVSNTALLVGAAAALVLILLATQRR